MVLLKCCVVNIYSECVCVRFREKTQLHRTMEQIQSELQEVKDKCEDLRAARQEAVRELLTLQDQHRDEVRLIQADLQVCIYNVYSLCNPIS